jgi:hypothetical protein
MPAPAAPLLKRNDSVNGTYSARWAHLLTSTGCSFSTDAALRALQTLQARPSAPRVEGYERIVTRLD